MMPPTIGQGTSQADKEEMFLLLSGLDRTLFERWKFETEYGTKEGSVDMGILCLLHALRRDRAINPNLDHYAFLTPEKKAEIAAEFHRDIPLGP